MDLLEVAAAPSRQVARTECEKQTLRAAQELLGQQTEEMKGWDWYGDAEPEPLQSLPEKGALSLLPQECVCLAEAYLSQMGDPTVYRGRHRMYPLSPLFVFLERKSGCVGPWEPWDTLLET